jgi:hypothetical protein
MFTRTPPSDAASGAATVAPEAANPVPGSVTSLFGASAGRAVKYVQPTFHDVPTYGLDGINSRTVPDATAIRINLPRPATAYETVPSPETIARVIPSVSLVNCLSPAPSVPIM